MMSKKIKLFNNEIEMGLRILVILSSVYPKSFDVEMINYYDYFALHTKDIGGEESLHADVPNRFGELSVKRELINKSLKLLALKGLIEQHNDKNGIEYIASENTYPFLENLNEEYIRSLTEKVNWVCNRFQDYSYQDIKNFVSDNKEKWGSEITYCTIGLIDE
jgi:hypothetical protein